MNLTIEHMSPEAVFVVWAKYVEGAEAILRKAGKDTNLHQLRQDIFERKLVFWEAMLDNTYCGFLTTRVDTMPTGLIMCSIIHLYIKPQTPEEVFLEGMKIMEDKATKSGCHCIRMWSMRDKAFTKRLEPLGWKQGYVEFIKPLSGGTHADIHNIGY